MAENEIREIIRDFLNEEYTEEEIMFKFNLKKCDNCKKYELEEDLYDTEKTFGIGEICESCRNDIYY